MTWGIVITVLIVALILWRAGAYDKKKAKKDREAKDEIIRKAGR